MVVWGCCGNGVKGHPGPGWWIFSASLWCREPIRRPQRGGPERGGGWVGGGSERRKREEKRKGAWGSVFVSP